MKKSRKEGSAFETRYEQEADMAFTGLHGHLRSELEDTSAVYSLVVDHGGAPNMDWAGYASHVSLDRFRDLLENPGLSAGELESLMRKVARRHGTDDPASRWSHVMARYISRHANANL
jgi:hypothetical protein